MNGEKTRVGTRENLRVCGLYSCTEMLEKKLDDKSKNMVLVGYPGESSNYRLYDPVTKRVSVSRDVMVDEKLSGVSQQAESRDEGVLSLPKTRVDDEVIEIEDDDELVVEDPRPI